MVLWLRRVNVVVLESAPPPLDELLRLAVEFGEQ